MLEIWVMLVINSISDCEDNLDARNLGWYLWFIQQVTVELCELSFQGRAKWTKLDFAIKFLGRNGGVTQNGVGCFEMIGLNYSVTQGWAFHCPTKPPFSWIV